LCLASIVYHFDWLKIIRSASSDHELDKVIVFSLLCDLITKLKPLVTINASSEMLPTGIPPHADQLKAISKILESIEILSRKFDFIGNNQIFVLVFVRDILLSSGEDIGKSVDEAIEKVQLNAGNVTNRRISELLEKQTEKWNNY